MAFDVGNGLSLMGNSIAQTTQAMTIEAQRADLEQQKVVLADQLAGARDDKKMAHDTSERTATEAYQGTQNDANRANAVTVSGIAAKAETDSASIRAGAELSAANATKAAHSKDVQAEIDAGAPERAARVLAINIGTSTKKSLLDAHNDLKAATETNDPAKIEAAKAKVAAAEYSAQDDVKGATLAHGQAQLNEQILANAQTNLTKLQTNPMISATEQGKADIAAAAKKVDEAQRAFALSVKVSQDAYAKTQHGISQTAAPAPGTEPPLGAVLFPGKQAAPAVAPTAAPTPAPTRGLIDTPPGP